MSAEKGQFHEMPRDAARSFCLRAPLPCPASSSARGVIPLICSRRPNQSSCGNCLLCRGRAPKWGFSRVEGAAGPPTLPIGDDSHAAAASPALPAPAEPPALPRRGARPRRAPRWPPLPLPAPEPTATVRSRTPFPMAGLSSGRCARSAAGRAPPASPTVPCSAASGRPYPAQGRGPPPPAPVVGVDAIDSGTVARIVQRRAAAAGFDPAAPGGHSLKRGALTSGTDRGGHPARLK